MKTSFLLCCLSLVLGSAMSTHGGHLATYRYQFEADRVLLRFTIEASVLDHFDFFAQCGHLSKAEVLCLANYLNAGINFKLAEELLNFDLLESRKDQGLFVVEMTAPAKVTDQASISLSNRCFLEFDAEFANRVLLTATSGTKSYLLNEERSTLELSKGR